MALSAQLIVRWVSEFTSALDLGTVRDPLDFKKVISLTNGTGADQGDQQWHDQRTLAASGTENLDLSGSLTNAFGTSVVFTKLKLIIVFAAAANTNDVNVQRGSSNGVPLFLAASDGIPVTPGGIFAYMAPNADGIAVTAGTGDILTITNSSSGTSVTYDIILSGVD